MPHQRRQHRRVDALAAHVAQGHHPVVVADLEDVVEVAADLRPVAGRPVDRGQFQAGDLRVARRDQRLLQGACQRPRPGLRLLGPLLGAQQLALVGATLGRVEDDDPDHLRLTVVVALEGGVDQHG